MSEQEEVKRDYIVELELLTHRTFHIEACNTREEAEAIAEELALEDAKGDTDITNIDSYPAESQEEYN